MEMSNNSVIEREDLKFCNIFINDKKNYTRCYAIWETRTIQSDISIKRCVLSY